jgi:hypothetical protein
MLVTCWVKSDDVWKNVLLMRDFCQMSRDFSNSLSSQAVTGKMEHIDVVSILEELSQKFSKSFGDLSESKVMDVFR